MLTLMLPQLQRPFAMLIVVEYYELLSCFRLFIMELTFVWRWRLISKLKMEI
jgi:hypothetical protein